jgi:hypothetical protein
VGCLIAHTGIAADQLADEELEEIEVERYSPADEQRETPRFFERDRREHGTTTEVPRH